jgi:hypothetical protein
MNQHLLWRSPFQRFQSSQNRFLPGGSTGYQAHIPGPGKRLLCDLFRAGRNGYHNRPDSDLFERFDGMSDNRFPAPARELLGDRLTGAKSLAGCDHHGGSARKSVLAGHRACR